MTRRVAVAGGVLLMVTRYPSGVRPALVEWEGGADGRLQIIGPATTSDVLVAHAGFADPARLGIADLIVCSAEQAGSDPAGRLRAALRGYPGCAVAAVQVGASGCLVGTPGEAPATFEVRDGDGTKSSAWLCAAFVHGWLTAGQQLGALEPRRLRVTTYPVPRAAGLLIPEAVISISLGLFYEPSVSEASASNRRRTSFASGAPVSE